MNSWRGLVNSSLFDRLRVQTPAQFQAKLIPLRLIATNTERRYSPEKFGFFADLIVVLGMLEVAEVVDSNPAMPI